MVETMQYVVKITRKGQTTIPREFREKLGLKEGDMVLIEYRDNELIIKPVKKLEDLGGVDAEFGDVNEIKKDIDKMRDDY
jgi:AbrB family looped-hinge helix DNA binding protein